MQDRTGLTVFLVRVVFVLFETRRFFKVARFVFPDLNSSEVYHLIYTGKSVTYAQSLDRTFGKISAKFNEPNPANRN